jgi:hypothetical protein
MYIVVQLPAALIIPEIGVQLNSRYFQSEAIVLKGGDYMRCQELSPRAQG